MTALIIILCVVLIVVIAVQIGRVTELAAKLRGEEEMEARSNTANSRGMLVFMVLFLVACVVSPWVYKNWMLGYGPHESASVHGKKLDSIFNITLVVTGLVFFATQIALFYFSYKYRAIKGRTSDFLAHNNTVEIVWTAIPAVVMALLVIGGLDAWNDVMSDVNADDEYLEIEATGYQFAWALRHPGADNQLGKKYYKEITGTNPLGQVWSDRRNLDDLHIDELVLPVGKKVRIRITSRDVLHNFYLPHFRVKMDAVPGMPTYFVFTPEKTTEEYRQELRKYPEYQQPSPNDPEQQLWQTFNFELACAELCGKGHFSMRRVVRIVTEDEYEDWLATQQPYYLTTIRGSEDDPLKNELLPVEIKERKQELTDAFDQALSAAETDSTGTADQTITLNYVSFASGSAELTELSRYEIDNLAEILQQRSNLRVELGGHTDNTGVVADNMSLSERRAQVVVDQLASKGISRARLTAVGYGPTRPIESNDTEAGRQANRRTEVTILNN